MFRQRQQHRAPTELGLSGAPRRANGTVLPKSFTILSTSFTIFVVGAAGVVGAVGVGAISPASLPLTAVTDRMAAGWTGLRSVAEPSAPAAAASPLFSTRPDAAGPSQPTSPRAWPGAGSVPGVTPLVAGASLLAHGDRLKVSFFETVAVSLGDAAPGAEAAARATIFPRMDLSGEYVVDEAGGLDVPRLGWQAAVGQGTGTLKAQLGEAFERAFGRPGTVHVALVDRRPVYVLGGPRGGTTIRHAPGLIVLQALAEAGGRQATTTDTSRAIEAIREAQRLGEVQDRLARALVRQARLAAMRDGHASVLLPPATTVLLTEALPLDAADVLREATDTLARDRQAQAEHLALATRQVEIATLEVAAHNQRAVQARTLADGKARRLRGMEEIAARGSISQFRLADTSLEVAEATAKQDDLRATIAQAESRLAEAEIERVKFEQGRASQLALDIASAAQEVADLRRAAAAIRAVLAVLDDGRGAGRDAGSSILRRVAGGTVLLPAFDTTPLLPGDVLQIGPRPGDARPDTPRQPPLSSEEPS